MMLRCSLLLLLATAAPALAQEPGPIDLDALVAEALQAHPSLAVLRAQAEAAGEVGSQVASLPDPSVSLGASNFRLDDPGLGTSPMTGMVLGLQQGIPYPGKLSARRQVAERQEDVALQQVLAREARVELAVRERYWTLHFTEAAFAITEENVAIVNDLTNIVTARFSVGQAAQQDVLQVQVAESHLRSMLQERQQALVTAQRQLNSAAGRLPLANLGTTVEPEAAPVDRAALAARIAEHNPELAVASARISSAEASVKEARSELVPDFGLGVDYRVRGVVPGDPTNGADMISAGVRMSVPLWAGRKQLARVREQRAKQGAASARYADTLLNVSTLLESAIDQVERLDREIALYQKQLVPQSDQSLSASIDDYTVAQVGFISILQNWQLALTLKLDLERLITQRAQQLARIRALLGGLPENTP